MATPQLDLQALIDALTPKPIGQDVLSSRFASLFDPTYAQNATDINTALDQQTQRFGEDAATAAARLAKSRTFTAGQTREQQAAGGASGQLADLQLGTALQPYDQQAQDAATQSSRFATDTAESRRKQLLKNQQARAAALAEPRRVLRRAPDVSYATSVCAA